MGSDDLRVDAGGVLVEVRGLGRLGRGARRWVDAALAPLPPGGDDEADVVITVDPRPRPDHRAEYGLWLGADGIWLPGRMGLGTTLALEGRALIARIHPRIAPSQLGHRVYLMLVEASLWRTGSMLLRTAVVEHGGRRLAVTGWSGSGKTRVVLEALSRGGRLVGDDIVALRDGRVAPVLAELTLRPRHEDQVRERAGRRPVRGRASGVRPDRRRQPSPWLRQLGTKVGDLRRLLGERTLAPGPGECIGTAGPLDGLLILGMVGGADDARTLAALSASYLAPHAAVEAAALQLWGERFPHGLQPGTAERIAAARQALSGVPVSRVPAVVDAAAAADATDRLMSMGGAS